MMLKNKVALVTGASSGIGRAVALVWARAGARVVESDMNRIGSDETVALVRRTHGAMQSSWRPTWASRRMHSHW